jgi:hypothetical protein
MRPHATVAGLTLLTAIGLSGCASARNNLTGDPAPSSRSISKSTSTTTPARLRSECTTFNPGPPFSQPSLSLAPLLLTDDDAPGFTSSSPSGIVGTLGEFNSAAPRTIPFDAVNFYDTGIPASYDEPVYFGKGLYEMLAQEPTAQSANALAGSLASLNVRCNPGTAVELPGTEPRVNARVSLGHTYSSAIAYLTKGPYVVQLTWVTSLARPMRTLAPLPTASDMASTADAALARLPS